MRAKKDFQFKAEHKNPKGGLNEKAVLHITAPPAQTSSARSLKADRVATASAPE